MLAVPSLRPVRATRSRGLVVHWMLKQVHDAQIAGVTDRGVEADIANPLAK
jgi:hypothetical protein